MTRPEPRVPAVSESVTPVASELPAPATPGLASGRSGRPATSSQDRGAGMSGPGSGAGRSDSDVTGPGSRVVLRRDLGDFGAPAPRPLPTRRALGPLTPLAPTFCVDTAEPEFALTYDDGPDLAHTPGLLDLLAERGVRATFFVLSDAAQAHPDLLRRIVAEGHEVALHGRNHGRLTRLSTRDAVAEIAAARDAVQQIADVPVRFFRPPYGAHTPAMLLGWRRLELDVVIWSGWSADWQDDPAAEVAARARSAVHPGGILLMHDTRADPDTLAPGERMPTFDRAEVTGLLLDQLDGWRPGTVGDLLARHPRVRAVIRELWT